MSDIKMHASKEDAELILQIVDRADKIFKVYGKIFKVYDKASLMMDLTAVHLNGCPLDLDKLVSARDPDLMHDVLGIDAYLNRNTGRLTNHFLPRCAKPEGGAA